MLRKMFQNINFHFSRLQTLQGNFVWARDLIWPKYVSVTIQTFTVPECNNLVVAAAAGCVKIVLKIFFFNQSGKTHHTD